MTSANLILSVAGMDRATASLKEVGAGRPPQAGAASVCRCRGLQVPGDLVPL